MIASVHIADMGRGRHSASTGSPHRPGRSPACGVPRSAIAAPLSDKVLRARSSSVAPALIVFWDDDAAVDRFVSGHPLAEKFASGWHVRLAPLRAFGTWPGLPADIPAERHVDHEGPVAVLTLGRPRLSELVRFLRTSAKAAASAVASPGMMWGTGVGAPAVVRGDVLAVGVDAGRVDVRLRAQRPRPSRRDRDRPGEALPPRVGVRPVPPVRRARFARRQESAGGRAHPGNRTRIDPRSRAGAESSSVRLARDASDAGVDDEAVALDSFGGADDRFGVAEPCGAAEPGESLGGGDPPVADVGVHFGAGRELEERGALGPRLRSPPTR